MVLRKKLAVLLAAVMMLGVMSAPALAHHDIGHVNNGNQRFDSGDANAGGGQEKPKNENRKKGHFDL